MGEIITPHADARSFVRHAIEDSYSMEPDLINPTITKRISRELEEAGQLFDYNELNPTTMFHDRGMKCAQLLHTTLTRLVKGIDPARENPLPLFSVRVFEPGLHGTTIHRNDSSVGPWVIGVTLRGSAPFNVYEPDQLPLGHTIELVGDDSDPEPIESMEAQAGAAWSLYTGYEQMPHSSGIVNSDLQRELLVLYGTRYYE